MSSERDAHPDDGTIHAWLDRQLDAVSSAVLEAHLQRCDECAERVAEARGLIAGATRVVAALDDPTADGSLPRPPLTLTRTGRVRFPAFRLTPARSAIAAVLVVAVGLAIVHEHEPPTSRLATISAESAKVARTIPRAAVPAATVTPPPDTTASKRVAAARAYVEAQQETTVTTDRARVGGPPAAKAAAPTQQVVAAAKVADSVANALRADASGPPTAALAPARGVTGGATRNMASAAPAPASGTIAARVAAPTAPGLVSGTSSPAQCYRVESANGTAAMWGPVPLPFVLALEAPATSGSARVLTPDGKGADAEAVLERRPGDSLIFALRRIGYSGTLAIGAPGDVRAGVLRSAPAVVALDGAVAAAPPTTARRRARPMASAGATRAESTPAPQRTAEPAVPVVVRKVECPE